MEQCIEIIKIIVKVLVLVIVIMVVTVKLLYVGLEYSANMKEANGVKIRERNRQAAKEHLEEKYKEEFIVEEGWKNDQALLLFDRPDIIYTYARAVNEPDYEFRVYIKKRHKRSNEIEEIRDEYFWLTMHRELSAYFEEELDQIIKGDYEYRLSQVFSETFDDRLLPSSGIKEYLEDNDSLQFYIYVLLPPNNKQNLEKLYKEMEELMRKLYENYEKRLEGYLLYFKVKNKEMYSKIEGDKYSLPSNDWVKKTKTDSGLVDFEMFSSKKEGKGNGDN